MADGSYIFLEVYWMQLKLLYPDTMDPNNLAARDPSHGPIAYSRPAPRPFRRLRPLETPMPGAHLITPWLGFAHHGIYVGEGKVVHYGALMYDLIRKPVEEVTIGSLRRGRPVFVVQHDELPSKPAKSSPRAFAARREDVIACSATTASTSSSGACTTSIAASRWKRALEFPRWYWRAHPVRDRQDRSAAWPARLVSRARHTRARTPRH